MAQTEPGSSILEPQTPLWAVVEQLIKGIEAESALPRDDMMVRLGYNLFQQGVQDIRQRRNHGICLQPPEKLDYRIYVLSII
jgi:hypothetical protein